MNGSKHLAVLALLALVVSQLVSCAAGPAVPYVPPMITINTMPSGADVSVNGNYIGKSPIQIPMPQVRLDMGSYYKTEIGRADAPLQIEAQLKGYETKQVAFGEFHPATQQVIQPVFSYSAVTKTTPGYYTFANQINILLAPK